MLLFAVVVLAGTRTNGNSPHEAHNNYPDGLDVSLFRDFSDSWRVLFGSHGKDTIRIMHAWEQKNKHVHIRSPRTYTLTI